MPVSVHVFHLAEMGDVCLLFAHIKKKIPLEIFINEGSGKKKKKKTLIVTRKLYYSYLPYLFYLLRLTSVDFHRFSTFVPIFNCIFSKGLSSFLRFYTYRQVRFWKDYIHFCLYPTLKNNTTSHKLTDGIAIRNCTRSGVLLFFSSFFSSAQKSTKKNVASYIISALNNW